MCVRIFAVVPFRFRNWLAGFCRCRPFHPMLSCSVFLPGCCSLRLGRWILIESGLFGHCCSLDSFAGFVRCFSFFLRRCCCSAGVRVCRLSFRASTELKRRPWLRLGWDGGLNDPELIHNCIDRFVHGKRNIQRCTMCSARFPLAHCTTRDLQYAPFGMSVLTVCLAQTMANC